MDPAAALAELSTITRTTGQQDTGAEGTQKEDLIAIGRYAARLAAFERTVLPVAESRLGDDGERVRQVRDGGRQLTSVLHWLDRHLTGDVRARQWPGADLTSDVQAAVARYAQQEHALIGQLAATLDEAGMTELIRSYHQAEQVAPTRPHPNVSYDGVLGQLKFRLAGLIDDVRDGTESRPAGPVVAADAAEALRGLDAGAGGDSGGSR